jgi:CBS domain containing-hemolysin-like protein
MAPKSWAIAHPETAAKVIGIPSRIFIWPFRPLLHWVNSIANKLVAASGVVPVESAAVGGQNAETIRHLVELSARTGMLDSSFQVQLEGAIELETLRLDELVHVSVTPTVVPLDATVADVQRAAARSGHMRILVGDLATGVPGVIHVRDTLVDALDAPAAPFVRSALSLAGETPVYEVLAQMRATSQQLVVVVDDGAFLGIVTLSDILPRLLPRTDGTAVVPVS